jgi:iron complex transport system ATP-binding protein
MVSALCLSAVSARPSGARDNVLDRVDLQVRGSAVHAIVGPNGAGKTTLLRVLAGLLRPSAGTAEVSGTPIATLSSRARARALAVVPQSLEAIPPMTVSSFVAGGRYAWRGDLESDAAAIGRALERTSLTPLSERALASLSGGERQRALVARALAQDAPVLLCDEPTASLDVDQQIAVLEILAGEACRGRAVVVVTHELNLASQFADRVTLLHQGRVVTSGPPAEILRPEVLVPVYGDGLHFGALANGRPIVVPQRRTPDFPAT